MNIEQEQLSQAYKDVAATKSGQIVIADLQKKGGYKNSINIFDPHSDRKTCFNLGAVWICEYIQFMIDLELNEKTENCITEEPKGE